MATNFNNLMKILYNHLVFECEYCYCLIPYPKCPHNCPHNCPDEEGFVDNDLLKNWHDNLKQLRDIIAWCSRLSRFKGACSEKRYRWCCE